MSRSHAQTIETFPAFALVNEAPQIPASQKIGFLEVNPECGHPIRAGDGLLGLFSGENSRPAVNILRPVTIKGMKPWLRISIRVGAILTVLFFVIVAVFMWFLFTGSRSYQKVGGRWSIATQTPLLADSGRKPKYLVHGGAFLRKTVAQDITDFHYLGDDCIAYTVAGHRQDEMYAQCADHDPIFLDHVPDNQKISLASDPLQLNGTTIAVAEVKRRAVQGISNPR